MEWDKNTKIIVAVVVIVVVIAAAVGIGIAVSNNNNSGSGETNAKITFSYESHSASSVVAYNITGKNGGFVELTYGGSGIEIPANKTTIKSQTSGWKWDDSMKAFYKGDLATKITADKGTLTPIKNTGYACYELTSYDKGANIKGNQNDFENVSELITSNMSSLSNLGLCIVDVQTARPI